MKAALLFYYDEKTSFGPEEMLYSTVYLALGRLTPHFISYSSSLMDLTASAVLQRVPPRE
jgi:hypothetical protein